MSFIIDSTTTTAQSLASVTGVGVVTSSGALITTTTAISVSIDGGFVVNDGLINALSFCLNASADFSLMNRGLITTESFAININIAATTQTNAAITNSGDIVSTLSSAIVSAEAGLTLQNSGLISGRSTAINLTSTDPTKTSFLSNSGTIEAQPISVIGTAIACNGTMVLTNTGTIIGDLNLGDGNDRVDNRAGIIIGTIGLDDGNNLFRGGLLGEDILAGIGADTIHGEGGDDDIFSSSGNDLLRGGAGDDDLNGGTGADTLRGGDGDDTLIGGTDADTLYGGRGEDSFVFLSQSDSAAAQAPDRIEDFQRGSDLIDLSALTGTAFGFVGTGALSGGGSPSVGITKVAGDVIVRIDINGDAVQDMHILVADTSTLTLADFAL